jgi:hypothetical protein
MSELPEYAYLLLGINPHLHNNFKGLAYVRDQKRQDLNQFRVFRSNHLKHPLSIPNKVD